MANKNDIDYWDCLNGLDEDRLTYEELEEQQYREWWEERNKTYYSMNELKSNDYDPLLSKYQ